jgi:prephenate dehydrogenase
LNLAVVGVGLIGGSVGLAARARLDATVRGFDPADGVLASARERGAIDVAADGIADAIDGADTVFVAAPVGALPEAVRAALQAASPDCVVTDVGSTKRSVVAAAQDECFVGGHPLAGAETSGVEHARDDLFDGATWYLTPTEATSGLLYERLHRTIAGLGAQPVAIDPGEHDRILAAVSHLPHVLANVLVAEAADALPAGAERLAATGPSFRDATRVAGANSGIWSDIYLSNADALPERIDAAVARLQAVRDQLAAGDRAGVTAWNDAAAADRRGLLEAGLAGGPVHELRVSVPNEPGVVARVALELGRAGVNIVDMALYPTADMSEGVVALWVRGDADAERAEALIGQLELPVARA